ncbi:hypothetical protein FOZ60_008925 [Perkinsus olseni]|uniref:Transmembrane protein 18 n=1 Tax=Perkinsus olseni TaxID=32597 RepID=A0A7J6NJD7_PEROL|nr:hypothetical protein FOZ60_008925 [Perkinsus olseni]
MASEISSILNELWASLNATAVDGGRIEIPDTLLSAGPSTMVEAIDWRMDWWWIFLPSCIALLAVTVLANNYENTTLAIGIGSIAAIAGACLESLNAWGRNNWTAFSSQNYFDPNGLFIGAFAGAPVVITSLVVVGVLLIQLVTLALQSKAVRMRAAQSEKKKSE